MRIFFAFLIISSALVFSGCSNKKNTLASRSYHNLTAKYNIYFNGNQSYKEAMRKIETNWRDDYSAILPLNLYGNKELNKSVDSDMDVAIKKSTKLIKRHSITAKPKKAPGTPSKRQQEFYKKTEFCRWVDNSYLLIGKANFIKNEIPMAISTFNMIIEKYPTEKEKFDAQIWLLRTYIESAKYADAKELLDLLWADKKMPDNYKHELTLLKADLFIREKKYKEAIEPLTKVVENEKKRKLKLRYMYVLAQLHLSIGNKDVAFELFKDVQKRNSNYNMVFNARISQALAYDGAGGESNMHKQLDKLLADEKNADLRDQIYYAKAKLAQQKGDMNLATELYKQTAATAKSESNYKALAYLALADYYFNQRIYVLAGNYYDSTMVVLPKNYADYPEVETRAGSLLQLIKKLQIIEKEDSLRMVAKMPEKDRNNIIDKMIQEVVTQEQLEKQKQLNQNQGNYSENENRGDPTGAGKWYFYNPTTVSFGMAEFKKKWGDRKLEDHWRRRNKNTFVAESNSEDQNNSEDKNGNKKFTNKDREYYTQNLPVSDSAYYESENKSGAALYEAAMIYKEQLKAYGDAIQLFSRFDKDFSNHNLHTDVLYQWYLTLVSMGNTTEAGNIKNKLVRLYPQSHYAKLLTNPGYLDELKENEKKLNQQYELAFSAFTNKDYNNCLSLIENVKTSIVGHKLEPKYKLLEAMANGAVGNGANYISGLEQIIENFPNTAEKIKAQAMLTALMNTNATDDSGNNNNTLVISQIAKAEEMYSQNLNIPHWIVFLPRNNTFDANKVLFQVVVFNANNYSAQNLEVINEAGTSGAGMKAVLIKTFPDAKTALDYYNKIMLDAEMKALSSMTQPVVIHATNYDKLPTDTDQNLYRIFFEKHYLRK